MGEGMRRDDALQAYYALGREEARLGGGLGVIEFERTCELVLRHLPPAPAVVADIGGGPGRYALWLASLGYAVELRDVVPLHVEQARTAADEGGLAVVARVGDAREVDLPDASVDAALLLGPMYHLLAADDRARCLHELRRVLRPGGVAFVAAISRWSPRLHAQLVRRGYRDFPNMPRELPGVERTGVMPPLAEGGFVGYAHRPGDLREEVEAAGFECLDLVSVEGLAFALPDLDERLADATDRSVVFDTARALERVPELLGIGPHLLATVRRP